MEVRAMSDASIKPRAEKKTISLNLATWIGSGLLAVIACLIGQDGWYGYSANAKSDAAVTTANNTDAKFESYLNGYNEFREAHKQMHEDEKEWRKKFDAQQRTISNDIKELLKSK